MKVHRKVENLEVMILEDDNDVTYLKTAKSLRAANTTLAAPIFQPSRFQQI